VRKQIAQLLSICLLTLTSNVFGSAQEAQPAAQEKPSPAAQEKTATTAQEAQEPDKAAAKRDKAARQEQRAAEKAAAREKQAAARALAKERRAQAHEKQVLAQEKRMAAQAKRIADQAAREQRRALDQALRWRTQPDGTFKLLGPRVGVGKIVTGAPYSATAITEHKQTLSDGNQIIQKNEATYYRDSEGRTRIDQKLKTIGKWVASGEPQRMTTIFDPVSGNYYSLDHQTRTALLDTRGPQKPPKPKPDLKPKPKVLNDPKQITGPPDLSGPKGITSPPGPSGPKGVTGPQGLNGPKGITGPKGPAGPRELTGPKGLNGPKVIGAPDREKKKELLGTRMIEGVSAEGMRQVVTIPAGEIGNVAPIEIVDENWYSPELQVPVMTRHSDPRAGETIYRLTNINRSEPARSLFEVPADYRIIDKRAPRLPAKPEEPKVPGPPKKTEIEL
jgi:hypothetical protein